MNLLRIISRIIIGIVFIFSGFVKMIDPLGSAFKFTDYFNAFGLGFLNDLVLPLGILLSVIELVLGLVIILGYQRKVAYWVLMVFMSFFTILTLFLAIFDPVADCGCFGDAIILTNWQTFFKNVFLMPFVLLLFSDRNRKYSGNGSIFEWGIIVILLVAVALSSAYSHRHLPLIDFRSYRVGTNIAEKMIIPDDAPVDQYETTLHYRNKTTGKIESFTLQDYPRDTVNWEFIDSESRLVKKGYEPPIQDFAIQDPYNLDITDLLLNDPGYSLLMIAYDLEKSNPRALQEANDWANLQRVAGDYKFYAVTASPQPIIDMVNRVNALDYSFYSADEIMLKTIIRANPGYVMIKNGTIIGKWNWRDFPSVANIDPDWPLMIDNVVDSFMDYDFMVDQGVMYETLNFDVIQIDQSALKYIFNETENVHSRFITAGFILLIILVLLILQLIVLIKSRKN
ncbi:MAG TPA: DoxX family protein [Bacteroidaceae bacterium]|nr:DoxX family protein [Bacteroidaceae bacterium]